MSKQLTLKSLENTLGNLHDELASRICDLDRDAIAPGEIEALLEAKVLLGLDVPEDDWLTEAAAYHDIDLDAYFDRHV